jgi:hypothetical protein
MVFVRMLSNSFWIAARSKTSFCKSLLPFRLRLSDLFFQILEPTVKEDGQYKKNKSESARSCDPDLFRLRERPCKKYKKRADAHQKDTSRITHQGRESHVNNHTISIIDEQINRNFRRSYALVRTIARSGGYRMMSVRQREHGGSTARYSRSDSPLSIEKHCRRCAPHMKG